MKVYKFGCLAPISNANIVADQMYLAHKYQNKLIEIECERRNFIRSLEHTIGNIPELEATFKEKEDVFTSINKAIKKSNSDARKKINSADLASNKKIAKSEMLIAKKLLIKARQSLKNNADLSVTKEFVKLLVDAKIRDTRKTSGLWYGTYMLVEQAIELTKKMPMYDGLLANNPRFKRFTGEGRIGIQQFQPHEPISKVLDGTSLNFTIGSKLTNTNKSSKDFRILKLRIGTYTYTNEKNKKKTKPMWAEFPMVYHREIPADATVSQIQVSKRKIGSREQWTVAITVNEPTTNYVASKEKIGIDLGWRKYDNRITIATCYDSLGTHKEISVPISLVNKLDKVESLVSIRDIEYNKTIDQLKIWLKNNEIPEWLLKKTATIEKWKSKNRLVHLINYWNENRFNGDDTIMGKLGTWDKSTKTVTEGSGLLGWKYHNFHLWNWERSQSVKSRNELIEFYRITAAKLANDYGQIIFEDMNGSNMAKGKVSSSNRQLVAPFKFREICKMIFTMRGLTFKLAPARNTSLICHACKYKNEKTSNLRYFCEGCKVEIHRDINAAKNILARA